MRHADHLPTGNKRAPGDLAFVQGFVNTLDLESGKDALETPESAAAWLAHHGLVPEGSTVTAKDHAEVLAFRAALRGLMRTNNGDALEPEALEELRAIVARTSMTFAIDDDGRFELRPASDGVRAAIGTLQAVAYAAMLDGSWPRLKACANDGCQWAFFDHSRNHSGTWCSMDVCGNRMKVRSHRERKAAG